MRSILKRYAARGEERENERVKMRGIESPSTKTQKGDTKGSPLHEKRILHEYV